MAEELRVGKRVRRKPQRWEGDRDPVPSSAGHSEHHGHHSSAAASATAPAVESNAHSSSHHASNAAADDVSTATVMSHDSRVDTPVVEDGLGNMRSATGTARAQPSARDAVDYFHTWQLRAVSQQAAQLKALHVVLKRRLRKRSARSPEHDRLEEEALRNARRALAGPDDNDDDDDDDDDAARDEDDGEDGDRNGADDHGESNPHRPRKRRASARDGDADEGSENRLASNDIVPEKVRLPLEAYLPRRVRPRYLRLIPSDVRDRIAPPSEHPGLERREDPDGVSSWYVLPTVAASADWNTRKSVVRRQKDSDDART